MNALKKKRPRPIPCLEEFHYEENIYEENIIIMKRIVMKRIVMKKTLIKALFFLVFTVTAAGGLFAQADTKRHWLSVEVSYVGYGARYELMLTPAFSVGANVYLTSLYPFLELGIIAAGRFYPWGGAFFAELGLGYSAHGDFTVSAYSGEISDYCGTSDYSGSAAMHGFGVIPGLGWKIDAGKSGGFFIQPLVQLPVTFGVNGMNEFDIGVGLRGAFGLGWAF
jgi:hypothetical protein